MSKKQTAHDAALEALVAPEDRSDYVRRVKTLQARQTLLEILDSAREHGHLSKKDLAVCAGLDPSSVRRMLTAETANPTAANVFRLMDASGVKLEAVLPSGDRVSIV